MTVTLKGVADTYVPAGCAALTFSVAPTVNVSDPPVSVPVGVGELVKLVTVMVLEPLVIVNEVLGRVIVYV